MEVLTIKGESRSHLGTSHSRALRREGLIPCVLYGLDKNIHFQVTPNSIKNLVYSSEFKLVDLEIEGEVHKCIVREIQFHPISEAIQHVDFLKLKKGRKVLVEVPVRFEGVSPGEKQGGKLMKKVRNVKIKTSPEYLINEIVMDISTVNLGQSIRVRDIQLGDNVEIMNNPGIPIASIEVPRALKSPDDELEEEETDVEATEETTEETEA